LLAGALLVLYFFSASFLIADITTYPVQRQTRSKLVRLANNLLPPSSPPIKNLRTRRIARHTTAKPKKTSTLKVRRFFMGGELGGNKLFANLTSLLLVCLWTGYVVISAIKNEAEKK
jgi:hypothetical protein